MVINFINELSTDTFNPLLKWQGDISPFRQHFIHKTMIGEPEWFISSIKLANFPIGFIRGNDSNASAGTSINKEEAIIKSLGEGLERYCLSNYFTSDKPHMMVIDESKGYVRCADFEKSPESFKKEGIKSKVEHSEVLTLLDDKVDYVPFEYVHLGFTRDKDIGMHTSSISSGCAFYPDEITCIWKSICELVERHTFMRFWHLNFKGAKRILPNSITKFSFVERYKRIKNSGLQINIFEISEEFDIPVVITIISGDVFPYYSCGISCNDNIISAITKSMDEAISLRTMAVWNGFQKEVDTFSFEWVNRLEAHMELYANWENSPIMEKLLNIDCEELDVSRITSRNENTKISTKEDLKRVASEFKEKGFDIFYKDITLPEVEVMGKVFKVIIPQTIPLAQSYNARWLDYFVKKGIKITTLNSYPQPFS